MQIPPQGGRIVTKMLLKNQELKPPAGATILDTSWQFGHWDILVFIPNPQETK
jgi:hypothetical protein